MVMPFTAFNNHYHRTATHDSNVRRLYEEMEAQIRDEKERAAQEEREKVLTIQRQ